MREEGEEGALVLERLLARRLPFVGGEEEAEDETEELDDLRVELVLFTLERDPFVVTPVVIDTDPFGCL